MNQGVKWAVLAAFVFAGGRLLGPWVLDEVALAIIGGPNGMAAAQDIDVAPDEGRPWDRYPLTSRVEKSGTGITRSFLIHDGSTVTLRPNSRFVYDTTRTMFGKLKRTEAQLAGEAVLVLNGTWKLHTLAGTLTLTPGRYAVRCAFYCTTLYVNVASGDGRLMPMDGRITDTIGIARGDHLLQPLQGAGRKVASDSGFPSLAIASDSLPPGAPTTPGAYGARAVPPATTPAPPHAKGGGQE